MLEFKSGDRFQPLSLNTRTGLKSIIVSCSHKVLRKEMKYSIAATMIPHVKDYDDVNHHPQVIPQSSGAVGAPWASRICKAPQTAYCFRSYRIPHQPAGQHRTSHVLLIRVSLNPTRNVLEALHGPSSMWHSFLRVVFEANVKHRQFVQQPYEIGL